MIYALIPAGGKSTRMGQPKLALPLGSRTVLEHVIHALHQAGIEHLVVVIGPHVPELVELARQAGAHAYLLPEETPDMRATVEAGLSWLEASFHPQPDDDWLLVPADHPVLAPGIIRKLSDTRQAHLGRTIVMPSFQGRRGHPALIRWKHVQGIREHPAGLGINTYLRQHSAEILEVPVDSADILLDLDTLEDYEQLQRRWQRP